MTKGYVAAMSFGRLTNKHVAIAEALLGRRLKRGEEVHHVDENKTNNANNNLVVCPNRAYHKLLHLRTDAYNACGNANWGRCGHCKQYDDPANMYSVVGWHSFCHRTCQTEYRRKWAAAKKESLHDFGR